MLHEITTTSSPPIHYVQKQEEEEEEADPMFGITEPQFENIIQHLEIEPVDNNDIVKKE